MSVRHLFWTAAAVAAAAVACTESDPPPLDGVGGTGGGGEATCAYDRHDSMSTAVPLQDGVTSAAAYLCPVGDQDWFSFTVPAGRPLVQVDVVYPAQATTPVELSYVLLDSTGEVVPGTGAQDTITTDNKSAIRNRERLDPGSYFLRVADVGTEDADIVNPYTVTITTAEDADNNEPNEDCATATPLATSETGAIASLGDHDAFAIAVPAGAQIVDVTIQTAQASPVALKATLSSGGTFLTDQTDLSGGQSPILLHLRHGVLDAGTLCLLVQDDNDQQFAADVLYTVSVQISAEPDPQEQGQRNDLPANATPLAASGGTITGHIASLGDVDWYRVPAPKNKVMQVQLDCPGCTGIEPTIGLMYPAADSPCDSLSSCEFLLGTRSCSTDSDCPSGGCQRVPGPLVCAQDPRRPCTGDEDCDQMKNELCEQLFAARCALGCNEDRNANLSCPGFECTATSPSTDACAAAAVCTGESLCGALQFTRTAGVGQTTVRTAQPTVADVTYVAVRDFKDDGSSPASYTLTVTVYDDPDPNDRPDLNNYYYPYTDDSDFGPVLDRGVRLATPLTRVDEGGGAGGMATPPTSYSWSGSGCIGYETDVDFFKLVGSGAPCGAGNNCGMTVEFDRPAGPVRLGYSIVQGASDQKFSFSVRDEENTTFGDAQCSECAFYYAGDGGDYNVVVRSIGQDAWDPDPSRCYHFTVRVSTTPGCPGNCPLYPGGTLCGCP